MWVPGMHSFLFLVVFYFWLFFTSFFFFFWFSPLVSTAAFKKLRAYLKTVNYEPALDRVKNQVKKIQKMTEESLEELKTLEVCCVSACGFCVCTKPCL